MVVVVGGAVVVVVGAKKRVLLVVGGSVVVVGISNVAGMVVVGACPTGTVVRGSVVVEEDVPTVGATVVWTDELAAGLRGAKPGESGLVDTTVDGDSEAVWSTVVGEGGVPGLAVGTTDVLVTAGVNARTSISAC